MQAESRSEWIRKGMWGGGGGAGSYLKTMAGPQISGGLL